MTDQKQQFDFISSQIVSLTGDNTWKSVDGIQSEFGVDHWFINSQGVEAFANDDNGYITIAIDGQFTWCNELDFICK